MAFIDLARQRPGPAIALLRGDVEAGHADADTLDLYARAQAMAGDLRGASRNFAQASTLAPANTAILNRLAAVQLSLGQVGDAEAELKRSLALQPAQQAASEALVQAALARGDLDEARATVSKLRAYGGADRRCRHLGRRDQHLRLRSRRSRAPVARPARPVSGQQAGDHASGPGRGVARRPKGGTKPSWKTGCGGTRPMAKCSPLLMPSLLGDGQAQKAVSVAEAAHEAASSDRGITLALAQADLQDHAPDRALALLDRAGAGVVPELDAMRAEILISPGPEEGGGGDPTPRCSSRPHATPLIRRNLAMVQEDMQDKEAARADAAGWADRDARQHVAAHRPCGARPEGWRHHGRTRDGGIPAGGCPPNCPPAASLAGDALDGGRTIWPRPLTPTKPALQPRSFGGAGRAGRHRLLRRRGKRTKLSKSCQAGCRPIPTASGSRRNWRAWTSPPAVSTSGGRSAAQRACRPARRGRDAQQPGLDFNAAGRSCPGRHARAPRLCPLAVPRYRRYARLDTGQAERTCRAR